MDQELATYHRQPMMRLGLSKAVSTSLSVLGIVFVLGLIGGAVACGGGSDLVAVRGQSLEIHAVKPELVDKVAFTDRGVHYVVRPRASNRRLAVVKVTVVNRVSTVIPLLVNEDAAQLGDRRGERIDVLDPFDNAVAVGSADPEDGMYSPLVWGDVELARDTQIDGWMIFDVPLGLTLGTFWWDEVDHITADFIKY